MRSSVVVVVASSLLSFAGCASGPQAVGSSEVADTGEFKATGAVAFAGRVPFVQTPAGGASFNEDRVVGPRVDVSRRSDGSWAGWLNGSPVSVNVTDDRISIGTINVYSRPDEVVIGGTHDFAGNVRIVINEKEIRVAQPGTAFILPRVGEGTFGAQEQLRLTGAAADLSAPQPQLALALLAAL